MILLRHEPTRTLWTEENTQGKGHRWDKSGSQLQPPCDFSHIDDSKVRACTQEDTKGGPELPGHDQATANDGGSILGGEDRDCDFFQAHSDTEQDTTGTKLTPMLRKSRADGRHQTENGSNENGPPSANPVVDGIRKPASAVMETVRDVSWRLQSVMDQAYQSQIAM